MLLQSYDTREEMGSHMVTLYVIDFKIVGMIIGHFIYLRVNKVIKVKVSDR